jgi:hypothetical protein
MEDGGKFEVLPAGEMRETYGLTAENRPTISLDPTHIPTAFHHLIPLAEQFGISDDLIRKDVLRKTPKEEVESMRRAVTPHQTAILDWLAGPESYGPKFSAEYIAFSCLLMAADGY